MAGYTWGEFSTACDGLGDRGLIGLAQAREPKWRRVTLRVRGRGPPLQGWHRRPFLLRLLRLQGA